MPRTGPRLPGESKRVAATMNVSALLPLATYQKLRTMAHKRGLSRSRLMVTLIEKAIAEEQG